MATSPRPFAVVTGASTGIGRELAALAVKDGYDLLAVANEPEIEQLKSLSNGVSVETLQADLGTEKGLDQLLSTIGNRPVDALVANAGRGLGDDFFDQEFERAKDVVDLNITGTIRLIHDVGRRMRARNSGRILIVGSIAGFIPGAFQSVYNGTKAFLDSFSYAIRNELKENDVTVTCLMPGPTDTQFFERADMEDTPVGKDDDKDDPAKVAADGWKAMQKGKAGVVGGSFMNKVQATFAGVIPDTLLAEMHRHMAEPEHK